MKLLQNFTDRNVAEAAAARLRAKGIMTFISSGKSHQLSSTLSGALMVGLWVVIPEQYNDGVALFGDNDHEVSNPIPEEEMAALEAQAKINFQDTSKQFYNRVFTGALAIVLLIIFVMIILAVV